MRAVVFLGNSAVEVRQVPDPEPRPGQVLIRARATAICGSELKSYRAPEGPAERRTLNAGHEIAGEVVAVNQTGLRRPGDRIVVNVFETGCGRCYHCRKGDTVFCKERSTVWSAHQDYLVAPATACFTLPDDIPFETGVLLGGDFVGTSFRAVRRVGVAALDSVLIIGAGPIGLGVLSILRHQGLRVMVSEPSAYRRDLCERAGATVFDPSTDVATASAALTAGLGPSVVFDCVGRPETQNLALDAARVLGKVCFIGENPQLTINPSAQIIHKQLTLVGSLYFNKADYEDILALYRQGYRPDQFVTHRFPIEQADAAYRTFAAGKSGKVLLTYD